VNRLKVASGRPETTSTLALMSISPASEVAASRQANVKVWPFGVYIAALALIALVTLTALVLLPDWAVPPSPASPSQGQEFSVAERQAAIADVRQVILWCAGGLIAIVTLLETLRRGDLARREFNSREREAAVARHEQQVRLRNERFGLSAEKLGHEHVAVRLAGVIALAALADEWLDESRSNRQKHPEGADAEPRVAAQQIIDLLCAYLLSPLPVSGESATRSSEQKSATPDGPPAPEVTVRRAIVRNIVQRLTPSSGDGSTVLWSGMHFDLDQWKVEGDVYDFRGVVLSEGTVISVRSHRSISGGQPAGIDFSGMTVSSGGRLDLSGAGVNSPDGLTLVGISVDQGGMVDCSRLSVGGAVDMSRLSLDGGAEVRLRDMRVHGGGSLNLAGSTLRDGTIDVVGTRVDGPKAHADSRAGSTLSMAGVHVARRAVIDLRNLELSGGDADLDHLQLEGKVDVSGAELTGVSRLTISGEFHNRSRLDLCGVTLADDADLHVAGKAAPQAEIRHDDALAHAITVE